MSSFNMRFKELKASGQMSNSAIAKLLDIDEAVVGCYEDNALSPSISELVKLAKIFGVSVDYLVGNSSSPKPVFDTTAEERHILAKYREMSPSDKRVFFDILFNLFPK